MEAVEDAYASTINAVLEIDGLHPTGKLIGMQGHRSAALASGYFRTTADAAPFGMFQGELTIDGRAVANSRLHGDVLTWSDLDAEHQKRTGLPASGSLRFSPDGSKAAAEGDVLAASRLTTREAITTIQAHHDLHPALNNVLATTTATLGDGGLQPSGLLAMDPCRKDKNNALQDVVQAAVTKDLSDIMNSLVPSKLWDKLFPNVPQATLTGTLAEIAASPVEGVKDPLEWYRSLATAVLSSGLAGGSDVNCQYLNGPRAAEWLKTQVATSKVYHDHGQKLFHIHWQKEFPLTAKSATVQINHAGHSAG